MLLKILKFYIIITLVLKVGIEPNLIWVFRWVADKFENQTIFESLWWCPLKFAWQVPIVKLRHAETDVKVDISFNMEAGVRSVVLIKVWFFWEKPRKRRMNENFPRTELHLGIPGLAQARVCFETIPVATRPQRSVDRRHQFLFAYSALRQLSAGAFMRWHRGSSTTNRNSLHF